MGVSHFAWLTSYRMPCRINLSNSKSILGFKVNGTLFGFIQIDATLGSRLKEIGVLTYLPSSELNTSWNSRIRSAVALVMVLMPVTPKPRELNQSRPSRLGTSPPTKVNDSCPWNAEFHVKRFTAQYRNLISLIVA